MRELPVTLALSLLVHAGVVTAYVATVDPEPSRSVARTAPAIEVVPPAPDVTVEVTLLPDETALLPDDTVKPFPDGAPIASARPARRSVVATTRATTELAPPVIDAPPVLPEKTTSLSMRRGKPEPTIHRPGSDGISDEMLKQMVDGTIQVKISNLPGARENADLEQASARLGNAKWVQNATPDELTAARWDRAAARQAKKEVELVEQKDGTYTSNKTTFTAKVNRDGTVDIEDKPNWQQKSLFRAEFDVTDAFMRRHGNDPYASEKRKYLDRTRDQRVEIGKRYRAEQLASSARLMANNLARLWAATSDPQKRKDELFALWDECAETGDAELVAGGVEARRLLVNWVHAKGVQFSPAELTAFNARKHSKSTFAP